jgi:hypothetical protein
VKLKQICIALSSLLAFPRRSSSLAVVAQPPPCGSLQEITQIHPTPLFSRISTSHLLLAVVAKLPPGHLLTCCCRPAAAVWFTSRKVTLLHCCCPAAAWPPCSSLQEKPPKLSSTCNSIVSTFSIPRFKILMPRSVFTGLSSSKYGHHPHF